MTFPDSFETARLVLRPIVPADAAAIFEGYAQDAEVTRYLGWPPHRSIADTHAYIEACLATTTARTYALVLRETGTLVGTFDLRQTGATKLGFGYVLARSHWGAGLMTEALREIVDWALAQPDIWRIGDVADCDNPGSARVMEKAGLEREGVLRRWGVHPNLGDEPRDCVSYARTR